MLQQSRVPQQTCQSALQAQCPALRIVMPHAQCLSMPPVVPADDLLPCFDFSCTACRARNGVH